MSAIAAATSFAAVLVLTPLVRAAARRWGFVDRPNARSSHSSVIPRAGGVALVIAVGFSLVLARPSWWALPGTLAFLGGGLLLVLVGVADDRWDLPPGLRLLVQLAAAVAVVAAAGAPERLFLPPPLDLPLGPLGPAFGVLWIVGVMNFYNFMDGIDGLAGLQAVVTGAAIALASSDPGPSFLGAAIAGAAAGFLVFNWAPASIFLGDAGSGVIGYTLSTLPLLAARESKAALAGLVAVSLWFFLADATWTLARRALRGARVHEAHREHLYQRLVISGLSHARVSAGLGAGAFALTVLGLLAARSGVASASWAVLLLAGVLFGLEILLVRARERARATASGSESVS